MSHHYAGPNFGFPGGDARLNLTDLYAFSKPGDRAKSIIVVNVHPSDSLQPPGKTTPVPFATEALYEIKIDTNGDAVADITYRARFSQLTGGRQSATLSRIDGAKAENSAGQILFRDVPVSQDQVAHIAEESEGHRFFSGWRSDPFFFDPLGALDNFHFTGRDFFTDKDVCSIVLEVPNSALGAQGVGIWARIMIAKDSGWLQVDRTARPSQGVFLPGDSQATYLAAEPVNDAQFIPVFAHSLEHTGAYEAHEARRVASALLPDILHFDHSRPMSYPDNGRTLRDDALDHFLAILTNGKISTDGIGPHGDLLSAFPYLGPPHHRYLEDHV
jgi:hypothetical protein